MFNKTAMISLKTGKQWYTISRGRTIKRELSSTSVSITFNVLNSNYIMLKAITFNLRINWIMFNCKNSCICEWIERLLKDYKTLCPFWKIT
jgi:hypothetical protein